MVCMLRLCASLRKAAPTEPCLARTVNKTVFWCEYSSNLACFRIGRLIIHHNKAYLLSNSAGGDSHPPHLRSVRPGYIYTNHGHFPMQRRAPGKHLSSPPFHPLVGHRHGECQDTCLGRGRGARMCLHAAREVPLARSQHGLGQLLTPFLPQTSQTSSGDRFLFHLPKRV